MSRRTPPQRSRRRRKQRQRQRAARKIGEQFRELLDWFLPEGQLFAKDEFHGNVRWTPEFLMAQALLWAWQETRQVTDAFSHTLEVCAELGLSQIAGTYTAFMNALSRYADLSARRLRERFQDLAEKAGGRFFRTGEWVLIGFDGSRATAPRTCSNERAFCAPNYGHGKRAKYGQKKSRGLRRRRNQQCPAQPQAPQVWITMLWQMGLRLPWSWRLGPSNASERDHVREMLADEEFPENTLFCGDAGFVGYPLWSAILRRGGHFVVRVGANVKLLSQRAQVEKLPGGIVLCWPKDQIKSGQPPLRLRLLQVTVGRTKVWLLTSVLDPRRLTHKQLVRVYKMRWGIEVEFRGLKQTIDKHKLRCRNSKRLLVELDWSLRGMAVAELLALRAQLASRGGQPSTQYDPADRSLAGTLRVLRKCMRNLSQPCDPHATLWQALARATVQRYARRVDKRARYRPANPDKKPLGDPQVIKISDAQRAQLKKHPPPIAA